MTSTKRKSVLVLTSTFPRWPGDATPRFVLDLSRRLTDRFDVVVIAPHYPGAARSETLEGVRVTRFRYAPAAWQTLAGVGGVLAGIRTNPIRMLLIPLFVSGLLWATFAHLLRQRVDVVHAHWLIPQGTVALLARWFSRSRAKILCTSHGGDLYALANPIGMKLKRAVIRNVDALTVVSQAMMHTVTTIDPIASKKAQVAPMGADLKWLFTPVEAIRSRDTILFVGRLAEKKGLAVLLRAMTLTMESTQGLTLRVVGTGPELSSLMSLSNQLGLDERVTWLGALPHEQIVGEYRQATCLVFPSIVASDGDQEGLGLVPVEALGCECPVIASDLPAIRDVIRHYDTGLLVEAGSAQAIAHGIEILVNDPMLAKRLAKQGREYVLGQYSWEEAGARYVSIIGVLGDE